MKNEAVKERIKFYTEYLKIFWITAIAIGGGVIGLFRFVETWKEFLLFVVGIWILGLILLGIIKLTVDINMLIKKLEEDCDGNS
ncbi:hypothetical protein [Hydrogenivirga sp.]